MSGRPETREARPRLLLPVASVGIAFLVLPLVSLVVRAPFRALPHLFADPAVRQALWLSLLCSASAAALSLVLGLPVSWVLSRSRGAFGRLLRGVVTLPLVLPPVVGGVALLLALGRTGVLGALLYRLSGLALPFTTAGAVTAETFVAMPFLVLTLDAAFRGADRGLGEAAETLGATGWYAFRHVTLPLVAPALVSGLALSWARALGEFGATITFAGSFPGRTETMPLAVYLAVESDPEAAIAMSLLLLLVSLGVLLSLRGRWADGWAR